MSDSEHTRQRYGSYDVQEQLAVGHVTEVLLAAHGELGHRVVLKVLKPSLDPQSSFGDSLAFEASVLASLRHPAIPRMLEFHSNEHGMWMATDFCEGFPLRKVLDTAPRLAPHVAVEIALQLAEALQHVHEQGFVHGDVQPSNVIVGVTGDVFLIDLGNAVRWGKAAEQESSRQPLLGSGEPYMSPEQVLGQPMDGRSDIFALGVLLYEMLTGQHPFVGKESTSVASAIRHEIPPPVRKLVEQVPRELSQLVSTCMNKAPADRYPSMHRVRVLLGRISASLGRETPRRDVVLALVHRRLVDRPPSMDEAAEQEHSIAPAAVEPSPVSLMPAFRLMFALFVAIVLGGGVIRWMFRNEIAAQAAIKRGPLRLAPSSPGYLRVVARPWAHVLVDGQHVETTPFYRPIPLEPGIHYVTLRHPGAPDERRMVRMAPGEFVTLDVTMHVRASARPKASGSASSRGAPPPPASATRTGGSKP